MPRAYRFAAAGLQNQLAFGAQKEQKKEINSTMTVRAPKFINSKIRVQKARVSGDFSKQIAYTGSVAGKRFSGLEEQQTGKKTGFKRTITKSARGGNWKNKAAGWSRFKSSNKVYKPEKFQGKTPKQKLSFMIKVIQSRGGGQFFLKSQIGKLRPGLYGMRGGKLMKLQSLNPTQPKINKWHTTAITRYNSRVSIKRLWGIQLNKQFARIR